MQDTSLKGTGNSRTLGSVPNLLTLYPTYEAFAQALINKTLPIDLGPLNPAGVQKMGTDLNTANLLKAATAALLGLPATAVPDQAFSAIKSLINSAESLANTKAKIAAGSYVGTGLKGKENPNTLTFPFFPKIVIVTPSYAPNTISAGQTATPLFLTGGNIFGYSVRSGSGALQNPVSSTWSGNTVSWYSSYTDYPAHQFNDKNINYLYVAIG